MRNSFGPLVVGSLFVSLFHGLALPSAADPSVDAPAKLQNSSRPTSPVQKSTGSANLAGSPHHLLTGSQHRISLYADDKQPSYKDVSKALGYLDLSNCMGVSPAFKPKPGARSEKVSTVRADVAPSVVKPEIATMTKVGTKGLPPHAKSTDWQRR